MEQLDMGLLFFLPLPPCCCYGDHVFAFLRHVRATPSKRGGGGAFKKSRGKKIFIKQKKRPQQGCIFFVFLAFFAFFSRPRPLIRGGYT
jgi:hypothetical protein